MSLFGRRKADSIRRTEAAPTPSLLTYQAAVMQGIGKRSEQQDSYALVNDRDVVQCKNKGLFAAVADGMGGLDGGKYASDCAVASIVQAFERLDLHEDPTQQLCDAANEASERIYQDLGGRGGTTLIACLIYEEKLWYVSVGDSALYLLRQGQLSQINQEHNSLLQDFRRAVRRGELDPKPARENPEHAALSCFVGMYDLDEFDCFAQPLPLEHEDVILICSDGISDYLGEDTIKNCLTYGSPRDMCSRLEEELRIRAAKTQDNYTAIVILCSY